MQIVLFVGNGVDLALKLKTGYDDFLDAWLRETTGEELCVKSKSVLFDVKRNLLFGRLDGKKLWSDLESALGALPYDKFRCVAGNQKLIATAVVNSVSLLQSELKNYLGDQQNRFFVPVKLQGVTRRIFITALIRSALTALSRVSDIILPDTIDLDIVSLNYTDSIDKIIGTQAVQEAITIDGKSIGVNIHSVIYAHGKLGTDYMGFGIDNMNQLTGCKVDNTQFEQCKQLCKRTFVSNAEIRRAESCIGRADLLMTYGVSWGETDLSWWRIIFEFLKDQRLLCVCPHVRDFSLIQKYKLELKSFAKQRAIRAMLASVRDNGNRSHLTDELDKKIFIPLIQNMGVENCIIKAGDFLGLNAIIGLIEHSRKSVVRRLMGILAKMAEADGKVDSEG